MKCGRVSFDVILLAHLLLCEPMGVLQVAIQVSVLCKPIS
jgi:hypothetical protein